VAAKLVDTNILIYSFDRRYSIKRQIARDLLDEGADDGSLVLAHQSIVEFVAAVSRPRSDLGGQPIVPPARARLEAENFMAEFRVVYPDEQVLKTALTGAAMYGLSSFDAHLWAFAEVNGLPEILSEDFEHGRHYGGVRVVDPFLVAADAVHELPVMYGASG
jgi:predicted nucleic acid-binding protein